MVATDRFRRVCIPIDLLPEAVRRAAALLDAYQRALGAGFLVVLKVDGSATLHPTALVAEWPFSEVLEAANRVEVELRAAVGALSGPEVAGAPIPDPVLRDQSTRMMATESPAVTSPTSDGASIVK